MSLTSFMSEIRTEALAKQSRFVVQFVSPPTMVTSATSLRRLSMFATQASLPPLNIETKDLKIYGPVYSRPVTMNYGDTFSVMFMNDLKMKNRKFFEDWMFSIVNPNTFNVSYQSDYIAEEMKVIQLDTNDVGTYEYKFTNAFPASLSETIVDYAGSGISTFIVGFKYRRWVASASAYSETN